MLMTGVTAPRHQPLGRRTPQIGDQRRVGGKGRSPIAFGRLGG